MTTARAAMQPVQIGEPWRVEMLGGLRLVRGDQIVTRFRTQKTAALLAYLAYFAGGTHSRELLADRFWPDAEPESARHSLRLALSDLRRLLEPPDSGITVLIAGRTTVELHPGALITDIMQFQQMLDRLSHTPESSERRRLLETAVDLYRGPLLPGMYEEWIAPQQIRREEQFAEATLDLIDHLEREGDNVAALSRARQAVLYLPGYETLQTVITRLQVTAPPAEVRQPLTVERLRSEKPRAPLAAGTITVLAVEERESQGGEAERTARLHGGHTLHISAGMCVLAFGRARDALAALNDCREMGCLNRAALHTGDVTPQKESERTLTRTWEEESGSDPIRVAEALCRAARPGLVVCTETTAHLLRPSLADMVCLIALGMYRPLPRLAPERMYRLLFPNEAPDIDNECPVLNAPRADVPNLPLVLTRFFGRECEQEELRSLLSGPDVRLLTLTGTGGAGKTRLALEAFRSLTEQFGAGVRAFVPLADLTETDRISDAVRRALNLPPPAPGLDSHVQIVDALNRYPCALLLLDNAEHLLSDREDERDAGAFIADLLEGSPGLVCVVTSRRPLGIVGEREFPVTPLPKEESVALFVERARAVRPDFTLSAINTRAVEELCLRLDGLPLAIELAAARVGTLSPAQMLAQLATRLDLLTRRGANSGMARHRSVRAAIQWSYDILPPEQRRAFARLSVFRGGWTAEAASAVLCLPLPDTLDLLDDLRRHSLILAEDAVDGPGGMRYRMLETLLAFGAEQLTPEMHTGAARCHAGFFAEFVRLVRRTTHRVENMTASRLERERLSIQCETERENIRAALTFCRDGSQDDRETGLRMATNVGPEWYYRGYLVETVEWVSTLLKAAEPVSDLLHGTALYYMGFISRVIGQGDKARQMLTEAADLLTPYPNDDYFGWTRANLALCLTDYGLSEEAERLNREAFEAFQRLEDNIGMASALNNLALIPYRRGDIRAAMPLAEEAMIYARRGDHPIFLAIALNLLCDLHNDRGDYLAAIEAGDESLALFRERDCRQFVGMAARDVGYAYLDSADWANAQARFDEAQAAFDESGARYGSLTTRLARANVALYRDAPGDREAVESLLSEAEETLVRWPYRNLFPHVKAARGVQAFLRKREPLTALPLLQSALAEMRQGDALGSMVYVLDYLAATHQALGDSFRAARLLSTSNVLREQLDLPTPPTMRSWREELHRTVGPLPGVTADWEAIIAAEAGSDPEQ